MSVMECRTIAIKAQAEAMEVVLGHKVIPTLECQAIEVHAEVDWMAHLL
jgi:hypothetical protein